MASEQRGSSISFGPAAGSGVTGLVLTLLAHFSVPAEGIRLGPAEITVLAALLALLIVAIVTLYSALLSAKDSQIAEWKRLYQEARPLMHRNVEALERSASVAAKAVERIEP